MSIDQDKLDIALENKQNSMLDIKQGFYSPSEGDDGDTGLCENNGVHYFGIKSRDKWHFTALKKDLGLSDGDIIDQSINHTFRNKFESYLNTFSTTIKNIVNQKVPRLFTFPFYLHAYMVGSVLKPPVGVVLPGISDMSFIQDLTDGDATLGVTKVLHNLVPFRCVAKRIRCSSNHDGLATDMNTARLQFVLEGFEPNGGSSLGAMSTNIIAPTTTNGVTNYWDFIDFTNIPIPIDASWTLMPNRATEPTVNKFESISGILTFEEVL